MGITSVRLNEEVEKPLNSLVKKLGRSKSYLINQAVKEFIARQSVADERWQETLLAIELVNRGDTVDEADVNAWLDSWGDKCLKPTPGS